jgi:hypothetical protein
MRLIRETLGTRLAVASELERLADRIGARELALQAHAWRLGDLLERVGRLVPEARGDPERADPERLEPGARIPLRNSPARGR